MNPSDYFFECDGPPAAYFELTDRTDRTQRPVFRGVYEALYIHAPSEPAAREKLDELLRIAYQPHLTSPENDRRTQFLIWRRRPHWEWRDPKHRDGTLRTRLWISNFTFSTLFDRNEADQFHVNAP